MYIDTEILQVLKNAFVKDKFGLRIGFPFLVVLPVSIAVQSCEANPHLPLHLCTVLGFGQQTQSAHYVITYLSYEIQLITTIACVWSSLALPEYSVVPVYSSGIITVLPGAILGESQFTGCLSGPRVWSGRVPSKPDDPHQCE